MWLFEILKSFWKPIAGLLAGLLVLFQRWRIKRKDDTIDRQEQVIRGHEAKEKVHQHDRETDDTTNQQIDDLRGRVSSAESPERAAGEISEGLDEYFRPNKNN